MITYLAVDKDKDVHSRESSQWLKYGIYDIRVDTMTEAIQQVEKNQFLFIAINADNIQYLPKLKMLRELTSDPILVVTSSFSIDEQVEALQNGADFFGGFSDSDKNMKAVMAVVSRLASRVDQPIPSSNILTYGDLLIVMEYHKVFIMDIEIPLTNMEMRILHYLLSNCGKVLTYQQICQKIYDNACDDASIDNLYSIMKRLRKKIWNATQHNYIETIRDVGYRLRENAKPQINK